MRKSLQQVTWAWNSVKGKDLCELSMLAQACDHVPSGHLAESLEILLQRHECVEAQATQLLPRAVAESLEIPDDNNYASLSQAQRRLAAELTSKRRRHSERTGQEKSPE